MKYILWEICTEKLRVIMAFIGTKKRRRTMNNCLYTPITPELLCSSIEESVSFYTEIHLN